MYMSILYPGLSISTRTKVGSGESTWSIAPLGTSSIVLVIDRLIKRNKAAKKKRKKSEL